MSGILIEWPYLSWVISTFTPGMTWTWLHMQDPKYYIEKFYVLKVDENNVRMSEFIKTKIGSFDNGKAFYEFKQSEDLPCYKEVIHVPMSILDHITIQQVMHNTV